MRPFSTKAKWAFGLLIFYCIGSIISTFASMSEATAYVGLSLHLLTICQFLPAAASAVLMYYDHKFTAPRKGNFSLLYVWAMALVWIAPAVNWIAYLSMGTDNVTATMWGQLIGGLVIPTIIHVLLYQDGKQVNIAPKTDTADTQLANNEPVTEEKKTEEDNNIAQAEAPTVEKPEATAPISDTANNKTEQKQGKKDGYLSDRAQNIIVLILVAIVVIVLVILLTKNCCV